MAEYILTKISDGSTLERTDSNNEAASFPPDVSQKGLKWYPLIKKKEPSFDRSTQVLETNDGVVLTDYVQDWTVRSKTQKELDKDAADLETNKNFSADNAIADIFGKIAFDMENRVRTLEGKGTITGAQYKAAVKARL